MADTPAPHFSTITAATVKHRVSKQHQGMELDRVAIDAVLNGPLATELVCVCCGCASAPAKPSSAGQQHKAARP